MTNDRETQLLAALEWLLNIRRLASTRPSLALVLLETQPEGACLIKLGKIGQSEGEPAPDDVSRLNREEKRLISIGSKIPAIKNLRERSRKDDGNGTMVVTLGLRDAKTLCDNWESEEIAAGRLARNRNNIDPYAPPVTPTPLLRPV